MTIVIAGIVSILSAVIVWQLLSVQGLSGGGNSAEITIDYAQLERVVGIWETRTPFSFVGEKTAETEESKTKISVSIRNGSAESGAASDIAKEIEGIRGITKVTTGNAKETTVTSIASKSSVPEEINRDIIAIIELRYETITQSALSDNAEFDVIVTLGST
jgi:hypothetical protein